MDIDTALIEALAELAWPVLLGAVLLWLRKPLQALLDSASSRKFTLKVGDHELTMEEASDQQRELIGDLQRKIVDIDRELKGRPAGTRHALGQRRLGDFPIEKTDTGGMDGAAQSGESDFPGPPGATKALPKEGGGLSPGEPPGPPVDRILWVDDEPRNNSTLVAHLEEMGVDVHPARSTREALRLLERYRYDRVITDLERFEEGEYRPTAALDLIRAVDELGTDMPVLVYTSRQGVRAHQESLEQAGARLVTGSPTTLLAGLELEA